MCSFFLITHQCSSGALIRPATAGRISPILLLLRCELVCVFQCVSYPCLSLEPFQKWLCHPASQISRRKCSVFLPERTRPLLFLVQASKQVTAAQVVHLLRSACRRLPCLLSLTLPLLPLDFTACLPAKARALPASLLPESKSS